MKSTELSPRTWRTILKAVIFALKELIKMLDDLTNPNDDEDIEPDQDLTGFTTITARRLVEQAQLDYFHTKLSKALYDAAADMQTADCPDSRTAREQCRQTITTLLGSDAEKWRTFSDKLDLAMDFLAAKGKLNTITDYQRAYRDIAEGIEQA